MRSSRVIRASDCQCRIRNNSGFDPSILWHSEIWGAADEEVLNTVHRKKKKKPTYTFPCYVQRGRKRPQCDSSLPSCLPRARENLPPYRLATGYRTGTVLSTYSLYIKVKMLPPAPTFSPPLSPPLASISWHAYKGNLEVTLLLDDYSIYQLSVVDLEWCFSCFGPYMNFF